jgi:hypothetical protein
MRFVLLLSALCATVATAQTSAPARSSETELRLTVFRNPATGFELQHARIGVFVGFYPTILRRTAKDDFKNTNWIRTGISVWSHTTGPSLYASVSAMVSLTDGWKNGVLVDIGGRYPIGDRFAARLGVAVLQTTDKLTRVNPTVGFDIPLRRW